jgi:hypothetical protein
MSFAWSVYQQHLPAEAFVNLAYDRPIIAAERDLFGRHLSNCADCAEQLDMVRKSKRLEEEPEREETPSRHAIAATARAPWWQRAPAWRYSALAATLLLFIAAAGWLRSWRQAEHMGANRAAQAQALRERLAGLEAENERLRQTEAQLNQQQRQSAEELAQLRSQIKEAQARIQQQQEEANRELAQAQQASARGAAAPQINVLALDVYPVGMTQRDAGSGGNELIIPRNVRAVTLILNSQASSEFQSYGIEIVSERGKVVWRAHGLLRNSTNDYTISVAANYLAPGRYRIVIYGNAAGQRVSVESYQLNVRKL